MKTKEKVIVQPRKIAPDLKGIIGPYDCCRHCPDECRMHQRHAFACKICQPRINRD